jgi:hypothetical protein
MAKVCLGATGRHGFTTARARQKTPEDPIMVASSGLAPETAKVKERFKGVALKTDAV